MATRAGKTYAAVTLAYRLLKHAGAGRVLFLVDRNTLGRQALAEFTNYVTPDDGRTLSELYVVQRLSGAAPLGSSNVVISTVQRLYSLLRGVDVPDEDAGAEPDDGEPIEVRYNAVIPPETFDLIVVDECHRSIYGRWRQVLEYFDAHVVGLTATPVAQTVGFFHALVSEYTYQQAVADGVNVDFDVVRIRTELGERGGTIPAETVVPMRDRRTRRQRYQELDDDLIYTSSQLGRAVISKAQLRLVWDTFRAAVFTTIFPGRSTVPKTLVFAKDDNHAEEIVHLVREIFDKGNDFCVKITYTALDPEGLLARFRNSPELRIAVTVDMIATGTDVRPLECVFFLRDVQSWAYFEQMKGRGARTIDPAEFQAVTPDAERKDRFVIVDAVGVTDSPRVDAAPMQRSGAAQVSLETLLRKAAKLELSVEQASTLASRLARLDQQLEPEERAELERVAGRPLRSITRGLVDAIDIDAQVAAGEEGGAAAQRALIEEAARPLAGNPELRQRILEIRRAHDIVYDEVNPDRIISVDAVSFDERNPKHTVESWRAWIAEHRDEIDALRVAFDSRDPAGAYAQLADLAARISRPPHRWTPERLWEAYVALGLARNDGGRGVTELVSILRYELGMDAELRPYSSRVEENLAAWLARQQQAGVQFTVDQHWWIDRMAHVVVNSLGVTADDLDTVPFTDRGGVDGFLATFGDDRAAALLDELNQELPA
jgi:type I restriction enzyme R subunit